MGIAMLSERYALDTLITRGGMASVYRARDEVLARTVAVKVLHPAFAEDESFLERFRREALAAARLTHPNIVSIYDTGTEETADGSQHFIVMEYCGNGTLAELVAREGALGSDRIVAIGSAICDALSYAHANDVVHRDVKPGNVLISDDGAVKVSDFGIAKAAFTGNDLTTSGTLLGTVTYISPEQARGEEPGERSDIYSLGVVLYELAVGHPPFSAETPLATAMLHVKEPPPAPRSRRAGIPRDLEDAILAALAKDPADRPSTADELRSSLTRGPSAASTAVISPVQPARHVDAPSQHGGDASWVVRVLLLVAGVVLFAVVVTWLFSADDEGGGRDAGGREPATTIEIATATDFDPPPGDADEHGELVSNSYDGDPATSWTTETYNDGFAGVDKVGVGLVFDLGESSDVAGVEITTTTPGMALEIRASDEPSNGTHEDFDVMATADSVVSDEEIEVDGSGRYWLVWITELPGTSAAISEVRFFGT